MRSLNNYFLRLITIIISASILIYLMIIDGGYLFIYLIIIFYLGYFVALVISSLFRKNRQRNKFIFYEIGGWLILFIVVYLFQDIKLSRMQQNADNVLLVIKNYNEENGYFPTENTLKASSEIYMHYSDKKIMFYNYMSKNNPTYFTFTYKSPLNIFDRFVWSENENEWIFIPD